MNDAQANRETSRRTGHEHVAVMLTTTVFFLLNYVRIRHHAMWRDELEPWSLVRASASLGQLLHNARFEGHPLLWNLLIWPLARLTDNPASMQMLHLCIGTTVAFLILRFAPFRFLTRLALTAGYYFSFEYVLISRPYVLIALFVLAFCTFYEPCRKRPWIAAILLGLTANTNAYGLILGGLLFAALAIDRLLHASDRRAALRSLGAAAVILAAMAGVAVIIMTPPAEGYFRPTADLELTLPRLFLLLRRNLHGLAPVPFPCHRFWNTLFFENCSTPAAVLTACMAADALLRSRAALAIFFAGLVSMVLFQFLVYEAIFVRHIGNLFILFVACLWLGNTAWADRQPARLLQVAPRLPAMGLAVVLTLNLYAAGVAAAYHVWYPFSGARSAASFIRAKGYAERPILGETDYAASAVAAFLDRPIYNATGRLQTFPIWDRMRTEGLEYITDELIDSLPQTNGPLVLVVNTSLEEAQSPLTNRFECLAVFTRAVVGDENFFVYELRTGPRPEVAPAAEEE